MTVDQASEFRRFQDLVLHDHALFERLLTTADLDAFASLAVRAAAEAGCRFTEDHVRQAVQQARRDWLQRWI